MPAANLPAIPACRPAWNKGRIVGLKRPLMPKHVWALRVGLGAPPSHAYLGLLLKPVVDRQLDGAAAMMKQNETTPSVPSDEGDKLGLELGRAQGEALTRTLRHMTDEIAHDGREVQSGEYLVADAVEEAESMTVPKGGELE